MKRRKSESSSDDDFTYPVYEGNDSEMEFADAAKSVISRSSNQDLVTVIESSSVTHLESEEGKLTGFDDLLNETGMPGLIFEFDVLFRTPDLWEAADELKARARSFDPNEELLRGGYVPFEFLMDVLRRVYYRGMKRRLWKEIADTRHWIAGGDPSELPGNKPMEYAALLSQKGDQHFQYGVFAAFLGFEYLKECLDKVKADYNVRAESGILAADEDLVPAVELGNVLASFYRGGVPARLWKVISEEGNWSAPAEHTVPAPGGADGDGDFLPFASTFDTFPLHKEHSFKTAALRDIKDNSFEAAMVLQWLLFEDSAQSSVELAAVTTESSSADARVVDGMTLMAAVLDAHEGEEIIDRGLWEVIRDPGNWTPSKPPAGYLPFAKTFDTIADLAGSFFDLNAALASDHQHGKDEVGALRGHLPATIDHSAVPGSSLRNAVIQANGQLERVSRSMWEIIGTRKYWTSGTWDKKFLTFADTIGTLHPWLAVNPMQFFEKNLDALEDIIQAAVAIKYGRPRSWYSLAVGERALLTVEELGEAVKKERGQALRPDGIVEWVGLTEVEWLAAQEFERYVEPLLSADGEIEYEPDILSQDTTNLIFSQGFKFESGQAEMEHKYGPNEKVRKLENYLAEEQEKNRKGNSSLKKRMARDGILNLGSQNEELQIKIDEFFAWNKGNVPAPEHRRGTVRQGTTPGRWDATWLEGPKTTKLGNEQWGLGTVRKVVLGPGLTQDSGKAQYGRVEAGYATSSGVRYYDLVGGHILNADFGPPGGVPPNLTPLTKAANSQHEKWEARIKLYCSHFLGKFYEELEKSFEDINLSKLRFGLLAEVSVSDISWAQLTGVEDDLSKLGPNPKPDGALDPGQFVLGFDNISIGLMCKSYLVNTPQIAKLMPYFREKDSGESAEEYEEEKERVKETLTKLLQQAISRKPADARVMNWPTDPKGTWGFRILEEERLRK